MDKSSVDEVVRQQYAVQNDPLQVSVPIWFNHQFKIRLQAVSCYQACHFLGMPECSLNLAQCVVYLALAPKSIAVYKALKAATKAVKDSVGQNEGVPLHLRTTPTKLMKELGYAKGYIYTPDNPSAVQSFLPSSLQGSKFLDWPAAADI